MSFQGTVNLIDFGISLILLTGGIYNLEVQPAAKPHSQMITNKIIQIIRIRLEIKNFNNNSHNILKPAKP